VFVRLLSVIGAAHALRLTKPMNFSQIGQ
jgi:hypothetical protein